MTDWYNTMDGMNVKERLAQTKILTPAWLIETLQTARSSSNTGGKREEGNPNEPKANSCPPIMKRPCDPGRCNPNRYFPLQACSCTFMSRAIQWLGDCEALGVILWDTLDELGIPEFAD